MAAPKYPDRQFQLTAPDRVDVGDIAEEAAGEGGLHVAVLLAPFSHQRVGWSLAEGRSGRRGPANYLRTALTPGELREGIEVLAEGGRKTALVDWLEHDPSQS